MSETLSVQENGRSVTGPIRVVVVDDHLVIRDGVVLIVTRNPKVEVVATGEAGEDVLELLAAHRPDVLLTDLQMPFHAGQKHGPWFEPVGSLTEAVAAYPETAIAVFTQETSSYIIQSLANIGIKGYALKSDILSGRLGWVVERIHAGLPYFSPEVLEAIRGAPAVHPADELTPRQRDILQALIFSAEVSRAEQAASLGISPNTLQRHITEILAKLGVAKVEAAIVYAIQMRLVSVNQLHHRPPPGSN